MPQRTTHGAVRMVGRDPVEAGRAATPLELLFDLTFVIAFGAAASELAHFLAEDHVREGVVGFVFAMFAVTWAWVNFSWFASAYDTDDWIYRLTTMVQMVGVLILALGLPDMFESLAARRPSRHPGDGARICRDARADDRAVGPGQPPGSGPRQGVPGLHRDHPGLADGVDRAGAGQTSIAATFAWVVALMVLEMVGPVMAEHLPGGTPWHAHHIAERYGLLVIIALGEGLIGGTATLSAIISAEGWTVDVALLGLSGVGLTFGMWWTYFVVPSGEILHAHRARGIGWGYGHIPFFGALVAVGAGLHAAAYRLEHHSLLSDTETILAVIIPLGLYVALLYLLYAQLTHTFDPFHLLLVLVPALCSRPGWPWSPSARR